MKIRKLLESLHLKHYLGSCVNSFDEDGQCTVLPYSDVTEFAQAEENYIELNISQFKSNVSFHSILNKCDSFYFDRDNGLYIAYDSDTDIHYFFG